MISAPTLAARNDQITCCSQRSRIGRPLTGMRFGGTSSPVAAAPFITRSSPRCVPFGPAASASETWIRAGYAEAGVHRGGAHRGRRGRGGCSGAGGGRPEAAAGGGRRRGGG